MEYLTMKHNLGLAIITWGKDEISPTEDWNVEDHAVYYLQIDVYDLDNNLLLKQRMGGFGIPYSIEEGTKEFAWAILQSAHYHFSGE